MTRAEFETLVAEEFPNAVPAPFRDKIKNVAFLIEDNSPGNDLLGLYQGIPATARGDFYGVGTTLPDTITLYQKSIEDEAYHIGGDVRKVVRETIWHEVAHHFGYDERQVRGREAKLNKKSGTL